MADPQEGVYFIRNLKTRTVVTADSSAPNPKLVGSKLSFDSIDQQLFSFKIIGQDIYLITHVKTGRVADLTGSDADDGTPIITYPVHYTTNQQWEISADGSAYKIKNMSSGKIVDLTNSDANDGTPIINFTDNNTDNQKWEFKRVGPCKLITSPSATLYIACDSADTHEDVS